MTPPRRDEAGFHSLSASGEPSTHHRNLHRPHHAPDHPADNRRRREPTIETGAAHNERARRFRPRSLTNGQHGTWGCPPSAIRGRCSRVQRATAVVQRHRWAGHEAR